MQSVAFVVLALVAIASAAPVEQAVANSEVKPVVPAVTPALTTEVTSVKPELSQKVVEKPEDKAPVPVTRSGYFQAPPSSYVARSPVASDVDEIVSYEFDQQPEGNYRLSFRTAKGIYREETGELKEVYDEKNVAQKVIIIRGVYNYLKEDNTFGQISYVADENGYQAAGEAIPVAA